MVFSRCRPSHLKIHSYFNKSGTSKHSRYIDFVVLTSFTSFMVFNTCGDASGISLRTKTLLLVQYNSSIQKYVFNSLVMTFTRNGKKYAIFIYRMLYIAYIVAIAIGSKFITLRATYSHFNPFQCSSTNSKNYIGLFWGLLGLLKCNHIRWMSILLLVLYIHFIAHSHTVNALGINGVLRM